METDTPPLDPETIRRWKRFIAAIRGKAMVNVFADYRRGLFRQVEADGPKEPSATPPAQHEA